MIWSYTSLNHMAILLNPDDSEPLFQQIARQVRASIAAGRLAPGAKLPSHRDLAAELVVNHLTVKNAFDLLEQEGLVETRRGVGRFVSDGAGERIDVVPALTRRLEKLADQLRDSGGDRRQWDRLCKDAWKEQS